MLKDMKLAQQAANAVGVTTPLGATAQTVYGLFVAGGGGGTDFSGVIKLLRGK
jgi:3-hydroxyisobutyrate dehydrogenase